MQRSGALGRAPIFWRVLQSGGAALVLLGLTSCGSATSRNSGPPSPTPPAALTVTPSSAVLYAGMTATFSAKLPDGSAANVIWSLATEGGSNYPPGLITSAGAYQAPSPVLNTLSISVQAALVSDTSTKAGASITLNPLPNQEAQAVPIAAGTSVSNAINGGQCCAGTAGAIVSDESGKLYLLSNSHVIARSGEAAAGEQILQPGNLDTLCTGQGQTPVASLSYAPPLMSSNVDAAIAAGVPAALRSDGAIISLGSPDTSGNPTLGPPAQTTMTAAVGESVAKSGRGSGLTCGSITAIETTITVNFPASCGATQAQSVSFQNQIVLSAGLVKDGDSGSLVVDQSTARPIGIVAGLSGDGSYATVNPIADVLSALDTGTTHKFNIVGGAEHRVPCGSTSAQVVQPSATLDQDRGSLLRNAKRSFESMHNANPHILAIGLGREQNSPNTGPDAIVVFVDSQDESNRLEGYVQGFQVRKIVTRLFTVPSSMLQSCKSLPRRATHQPARSVSDVSPGLANAIEMQ